LQSTITINPDGVIRDLNQEAQDLLRSDKSLVGQKISTVFEETKQAKEALKLAFSGKFSRDLKLTFRNADGEVLNVFCNGSTIKEKSNGRIESITLTFQPCAANKNELATGIIKGATDAIFSTDLDGTIRTWNDSAEALFERAENEVVGTTLAALFGCGFDDVNHLIRAVKDAPKVKQIELTRESGGEQRCVSIEFSRVISANNRVIGISAVCREVTEDKRQIQKIVHEFNTITQKNQMLSDHASDLSRLAAQMELFAEMAGLLQVCENEEEVCFLICRTAAKLYPHSLGSLYTTSDTNRLFVPAGHWGETHPREFSRPDCFAAHRAEPHLSAMNAPAEHRCRHVPDRDGTYLCTPLIVRDELLGVLTIQWRLSEISADSTASAQRLLGDAALALSNLQLRKELQEMAIKDDLTGLYNRRQMEEFLHRELVRCTRKHLPLSLIMFDVDHFKKFNDTHGHRAGDAALREVGRLTEQMVRGSDIGCRYGGEEFLIILPEIEVESAVQRAELIRRAAESTKIKYADKNLPHVTLSLGVASFPEHADSVEKLILLADAALYQAKQLGRNRVVLTAPEGLNSEWTEPKLKII
jgi:diguanylate cyclase (GGDEF)-like protein/PAS domain S-box-containing protein